MEKYQSWKSKTQDLYCNVLCIFLFVRTDIIKLVSFRNRYQSEAIGIGVLIDTQLYRFPQNLNLERVPVQNKGVNPGIFRSLSSALQHFHKLFL